MKLSKRWQIVLFTLIIRIVLAFVGADASIVLELRAGLVRSKGTDTLSLLMYCKSGNIDGGGIRTGGADTRLGRERRTNSS